VPSGDNNSKPGGYCAETPSLDLMTWTLQLPSFSCEAERVKDQKTIFLTGPVFG